MCLTIIEIFSNIILQPLPPHVLACRWDMIDYFRDILRKKKVEIYTCTNGQRTRAAASIEILCVLLPVRSLS